MARAPSPAPAHLYGPVLGLPALREALARAGPRLRRRDRARAGRDHPGCNQAFCAAMPTLAGPGDAVILPVPWYFNHKMWLDMAGIEAVPLPPAPGLLPDPDAAARWITPHPRHRAGLAQQPRPASNTPPLIAAFAALARAHGIALILDETYRDFHSREGAPHALFADPDWDDTLSISIPSPRPTG
jgi:aspartate/methionine/tyrosine aminotransferase